MHGLDGIQAINSGAKLSRVLRRNLATNGHVTADEVGSAARKVTRGERIVAGLVANRKGRTGK